jgi:hypothetical protein
LRSEAPSRSCLEFAPDPAQLLKCDARKETGTGWAAAKAAKWARETAEGQQRLAEQIRKILGKHYASKYRT